ncbi:hypothetical protein BC936DRAFT_144753 [Jimgerdemannia flammicorona]|uniref:Uncharacterized protein n=1 Tax=Jimgerdemannia flammicorona TaxID=994334 RepID=A0A433DBT1_9FUNG|nr:hypothetical protein BC936DRAFT_144753 [Jimgerdemannia flammicorona]
MKFLSVAAVFALLAIVAQTVPTELSEVEGLKHGLLQKRSPCSIIHPNGNVWACQDPSICDDIRVVTETSISCSCFKVEIGARLPKANTLTITSSAPNVMESRNALSFEKAPYSPIKY